MSDLFNAKPGTKVRDLGSIDCEDKGEFVEIRVRITCPKDRFTSAKEFHKRIRILGSYVTDLFGPPPEDLK